MCRIIGLFLLIKINKQTTKEPNNRVLPWPVHLCHAALTVRNSATCPINDNKLLMFCMVLHVAD